MPKLSEDLAAPLRTMQECARRIAKVSLECKLELDEDEYVQVSSKLLVGGLCICGNFGILLQKKVTAVNIILPLHFFNTLNRSTLLVALKAKSRFGTL